ncbi:hypothetical protein GN956_G15603 [Arapaima gigas]
MSKPHGGWGSCYCTVKQARKRRGVTPLRWGCRPRSISVTCSGTEVTLSRRRWTMRRAGDTRAAAEGSSANRDAVGRAECHRSVAGTAETSRKWDPRL